MRQLAEIKAELGTPYYESEDVLLYQGDCTALMERLSQPSFDLTMTSPPYNIGKEYERVLPLADYVAWCGKWMSRIYDLTLPSGSFWLNVGYVSVADRGKAVPLPYLLWDQSPFYLLQEVVWNYGAGVASRKSFSPRNEKLLWYVRDPEGYYFDLDPVRDPDVKYPNQKKNGKLKCNPLGKNPSDVWQIPKVTSGTNRASRERTPHPAQFPSALVERVIKSSSPIGGLVLDPFVGSGTTCVVARQHKRVSVGFDLRSDYLDLAITRLEASEQQLF
ncbi:DNA-methyltransferase [Micromonospora sp. NBC_01796]|uniref:DNA-methyltransferase n=1 Tax=Micromonospora sp. NBC_01796 TaxID=2975987 RepID=UPI002DDBE614|nr:site-specific DNA-methyltransferase [Micromonospora sp. NBC_01796]WSA86148.1 site-specific DNA-methyltransferase [Micromonospora sp. NBC_01796]